MGGTQVIVGREVDLNFVICTLLLKEFNLYISSKVVISREG